MVEKDKHISCLIHERDRMGNDSIRQKILMPMILSKEGKKVGTKTLSWRVVGFLGIDPIEIKVLVYLPSDDIKSQIQS